MKKHAFEYQHDGATWIMEVRAESQADAEQRLHRLQYATYLGEIQMTVPAIGRSGFLPSLICWFRNLRRVQ